MGIKKADLVALNKMRAKRTEEHHRHTVLMSQLQQVRRKLREFRRRERKQSGHNKAMVKTLKKSLEEVMRRNKARMYVLAHVRKELQQSLKKEQEEKKHYDAETLGLQRKYNHDKMRASKFRSENVKLVEEVARVKRQVLERARLLNKLKLKLRKRELQKRRLFHALSIMEAKLATERREKRRLIWKHSFDVRHMRAMWLRELRTATAQRRHLRQLKMMEAKQRAERRRSLARYQRILRTERLRAMIQTRKDEAAEKHWLNDMARTQKTLEREKGK